MNSHADAPYAGFQRALELRGVFVFLLTANRPTRVTGDVESKNMSNMCLEFERFNQFNEWSREGTCFVENVNVPSFTKDYFGSEIPSLFRITAYQRGPHVPFVPD